MTLLALLQAHPPRSRDSLTYSVMRTARWQYVLRGSLRLLADLTDALADGLALTLGSRRRESPEERR